MITRIIVYSILGIILLCFFPPYLIHRRSTVARAESEMRNLQNTLESFFIDHNAYPLPAAGGSIAEASLVIDGIPHYLTTPVPISVPFLLTRTITKDFRRPINTGPTGKPITSSAVGDRIVRTA